MLSVANLCSEDGWKRFAAQREFKVSGFYFMSPDILKKIATEANFDIVQSNCDSILCSSVTGRKYSASNIYYRRDLLVVLKKR